MADTKKDTEPKGAAATGLQDRVVMASRGSDGTPHQTPDFEFIGPKDGVVAGAVHQLQSVEYAGLQVSTDPDVNPTEEENEAAAKRGEAKAKAEVDARHKGAFA